MTSAHRNDALTIAQAAQIMREAVRDKSYQLLPLGQHAAVYLRAKRKRLTDTSYRDYESCLDKLARYYADLELADLEPPSQRTFPPRRTENMRFCRPFTVVVETAGIEPARHSPRLKHGRNALIAGRTHVVRAPAARSAHRTTPVPTVPPLTCARGLFSKCAGTLGTMGTLLYRQAETTDLDGDQARTGCAQPIEKELSIAHPRITP